LQVVQERVKRVAAIVWYGLWTVGALGSLTMLVIVLATDEGPGGQYRRSADTVDVVLSYSPARDAMAGHPGYVVDTVEHREGLVFRVRLVKDSLEAVKQGLIELEGAE
jgi:hypothetical protein